MSQILLLLETLATVIYGVAPEMSAKAKLVALENAIKTILSHPEMLEALENRLKESA